MQHYYWEVLCHLRKQASKNIWNNGRTRSCWFTMTICLCALLCQCRNFGPLIYVCGLTSSLFTWLVPSNFFLVTENQRAATSIPFPVCPWHSGKIADGSTCHSKKSVAVLLSALVKMLDAVNKLEMGIVWHGQQWQITKLSLYSVTNLVQELLDISSYSVRCTDHVPSFYGNLQPPATSLYDPLFLSMFLSPCSCATCSMWQIRCHIRTRAQKITILYKCFFMFLIVDGKAASKNFEFLC